FVINGNVWFVSDNHFKLSFPGFERREELPVFLDTRAYFRESIPGVVKLRSRTLLEDTDRKQNRPKHDDLGTTYFEAHADQENKNPGGVVIEVLDPRDRLRARPGDVVKIVLDGPPNTLDYRLVTPKVGQSWTNPDGVRCHKLVLAPDQVR